MMVSAVVAFIEAPVVINLLGIDGVRGRTVVA
jgi:hypothetical protein